MPKMQAAFEARRDRIVELLNQVKDVTCAKPGGAFYVMPNCTKLYDKVVDGEKIGGSTNLCKILLEKANIACVPGIEFGNDDYIRLSYASVQAGSPLHYARCSYGSPRRWPAYNRRQWYRQK